MASRLASQAAAAHKQGFHNKKAIQFYFEVCRCLPFIQATMKLEEMVTTREMRSAVKEQFKKYKHVSDPKVVDLLIEKGREELEVYLTLHKQRHHVITEYLEPIIAKKYASPQKPTESAFLSGFYESNFKLPPAMNA